METDLQGAIETLAAASAIEELIFDRYDRLVQDLANLTPNTPEHRAILDQSTPMLELANQCQLRKEQAKRRLIEIWSEMHPAPIFESLTRLDLPITNDPIVTVVGADTVTLTRETVQEWIFEELDLTKDVKL
jgi:hypothetical protein